MLRASVRASLQILLLACLVPLAGCRQDASDEFFRQGTIPNLRVRLLPEQEQQLRSDPRKYVDCTLVENDSTSYGHFRVKIKGSGGSTRDYDDRPALTLSTKEPSHRFHGLRKFHLNNSVQDETYLHELVAAEICAEAGVPTARVTHARVWLNDRDLGLYVLKEGYDDDFLLRRFHTTGGNLYDGGDCQEIDAELKRDGGTGPTDHRDLKALVAACREEDPARRWELIAQRLDVDAFANFAALELLLGHWDGYTQAHNNYRVYFRAGDGKAIFFAHGLDQILTDSNYPVFQPHGGLVAQAVFDNPPWQEKYQERVAALLPRFAPEKLQAKIDAGLSRLRPVARKIDPEFAEHLEEVVRGFRDEASRRLEGVLHPHLPEPLEFNEEGWAQIDGWDPRNEEDAQLEEQDTDGRACLLIAVGESQRCTASFRRQVLLARGKYRLEAQIKTSDVAAAADEKGPGGAGVRISGAPRSNSIAGTTDWQPAAHVFEITEESATVELIAELRATAGRAWFDRGSLRIVRTEPAAEAKE